jgi:hypothetical protein
MRSTLLASAALLMLPACHASVNVSDDTKDGADNVHIAMGDGKDKNQVSLQIPGLSAKVSLPDMNLGSHMDMDGIKLAPDTDVKTVDVQGDDKDSKGEGRVHMEFTNKGTPASLIDYYKQAATGAGYSDVAATATGVSAIKGKKQFALAVAPDGAGSRGTITLHGSD